MASAKIPPAPAALVEPVAASAGEPGPTLTASSSRPADSSTTGSGDAPAPILPQPTHLQAMADAEQAVAATEGLIGQLVHGPAALG